MAWIELTESDMRTRLAGAELAALQTAALGSGQSDPMPAVVAGVVHELRGRLRNTVSTLQAGETIPDNWLHHCLAIVRYRLFTRLPLTQLLTSPRQREYADAMEAFRQLGPILPDQPTQLDPTPTATRGRPRISRRRLRFTREAQEGL